MEISDTKKIVEIQQEFSEMFPHLKIEFFSTRKHVEGEGSPVGEQLDIALTLESCRTKHVAGDLKIHPLMSVAALEKAFAEKYGLNAQVFRKSGNLWLQTTATDSWSLEEQNRKGGASEIHYADMHE